MSAEPNPSLLVAATVCWIVFENDWIELNLFIYIALLYWLHILGRFTMYLQCNDIWQVYTVVIYNDNYNSSSSEQSIVFLHTWCELPSSCSSLSRHPVESGWRCCWSHQTGGWPLPTQVATLPGHSHNQLTPIEFQDRGLNPGPLEPVDSKVNCYNHLAMGNSN